MRTLILLTSCAILLLATGCVMPDPEALIEANEPKLAEQGIEAPALGDPAPAFTLSASDGARVEFNPGEPINDRSVRTVLFFFPAPATPNSTRHVLDLEREALRLQATGIQSYSLTVASESELRDYSASHGISAPLLADDGAVASAYGVLTPGGRYPQRTTVGIDAEGRIAFYERRALPAVRILDNFGIPH